MHIFHHNFKNIPCYAMSEVSLKRFYFALFVDGLTLKTLKLAFIGFGIRTLHMIFFSKMVVKTAFVIEYKTINIVYTYITSQLFELL